MTETVLFRGGLPYAPDVAKLNEAFPVTEMGEGTVFSHERLEAFLDVDRKNQRYRGVINSWIAHNRNSNGIFMAWEPRIGVKVLDPAGILSASETTIQRGIRQTGRGVKKFGWVERTRLDAMGQKRYDHQHRVLSSLKSSMDSAKKELAIDLAPIQSLPKKRIEAAR